MADNEGNATGRLRRSFIDATDAEVVPGNIEFRPRQAEDFDGDAELEGAEPVIDDGGDSMGYGDILTHIVISASGETRIHR